MNKHSKVLNEDKLVLATDLIRTAMAMERTSVAKLRAALGVLQFGQISNQDWLDYIEAIGEGRPNDG